MSGSLENKDESNSNLITEEPDELDAVLNQESQEFATLFTTMDKIISVKKTEQGPSQPVSAAQPDQS